MADTDDLLSDLLAKNAALFAAYGEWSAGQIMLLAGTADDPGSFNADGGKAGALGYYPVVNVSGQTIYVPCIARLKEIALGGANAETLAEILGTANSKLAAVDVAIDEANVKATFATEQGNFAKAQALAIGDISGAVATANSAGQAATSAANFIQALIASILSLYGAANIADALLSSVSGSMFRIGDPQGNYVFEVGPNGLNIRVDESLLSTALYDDVLALRTLRKYLRFAPGGGLSIGDLAGNYSVNVGPDGKATLTLSALTLPTGSVAEGALSTALYDDVLALRTLRKYFRFTPGAGLSIGDLAGNYSIAVGADGKATMTLASLTLPGGAVTDTSLSTLLYDDILALRGLRKMLRYVSDGGLTFGDPAGNYSLKVGADGKATLSLSAVALPKGTVTKAALASDVLAGLGGAGAGIVYEKTVAAKQQVALIGGAGETVISDGTANDRFPSIVGQSVRFASDRDGGVLRTMRCMLDGSSLVSERGLVPALNRPKFYILIGYGQSLSIGTTNDTPAAYSLAAYLSSVLMFNVGVRIIPGDPVVTSVVNPADIAHLVPAAASVVTSPHQYGQTHLESLAYRSMQSNSAGSVIFTAGVGGQGFSNLKKGTVPWANMIAAVQSATTILNTLGFDVEAHMFWQQGEADSGQTLAGRLGQISQLVSDVNVDIPAITGQSAVHVFAAQSPSLSGSPVPVADWTLGRSNPLYHCVGPMYDLPEGSSTQHLTSVGSYYQGELYWRAFKAVILDGGAWSPLIIDPAGVTINGAVITAPVLGAVGNLKIDTANVSVIANYGIEYTDNSSPPAISSVDISGTTITITLVAAPTATAGNRTLRAAWTRPGSGGGPVNGARTNICDQSTMTSAYDGKALPKRLCVSTIAF